MRRLFKNHNLYLLIICIYFYLMIINTTGNPIVTCKADKKPIISLLYNKKKCSSGQADSSIFTLQGFRQKQPDSNFSRRLSKPMESYFFVSL